MKLWRHEEQTKTKEENIFWSRLQQRRIRREHFLEFIFEITN